MRIRRNSIASLIAALGPLLLVAASLGTCAQIPLEEFDMALSAIPMESHSRVLGAIESQLGAPGFPAEDVLQLVYRLAPIPAMNEDKEAILLLVARAIERNLSIGGLVGVSFDLANALEEGLPITEVINEALKGITQGASIAVIEAGVIQRLTLLREVRDLLFERGILRASPGAGYVPETALAAESFDQIVAEIADTVSDFLSGGGSPFNADGLYGLASDRLRWLGETVVPSEDVDRVLEHIGPPDLTRVALAAIR